MKRYEDDGCSVGVIECKDGDYVLHRDHLQELDKLKEKIHDLKFIIKANQEYQQDLIKCIEQMKADHLKAMEEQRKECWIKCLENIRCGDIQAVKKAILNATIEDKDND